MRASSKEEPQTSVPVQVIGLSGYSADRTRLGHDNMPHLLGALRNSGLIADLHKLDCLPSDSHWDVALKKSRPVLEAAQALLRQRLANARPFLFVTPRCATSLATLPAVADVHPDALFLWIDAHGDLNTPETSRSGYLGGMPLSAAIGAWDSGYGGNVDGSNVIHIGARALGKGEATVAASHGVDVRQVPLTIIDLKYVLKRCRGRKVYIHLDTDVFDRADIEAEYDEPNGVSLEFATELLSGIIANGQLIGLEIAEVSPSTEDSRARSHKNLLRILSPMVELMQSSI